MTKPKRKPRAVIEKRVADALPALEQGKTVTQVAEELDVHRTTLHRNLKTLTQRFVEHNNDSLVEIKQRVAEELIDRAEDVLAGRIPPDVANAWKNIIAEFKSLLGLDAAKRAIVGHVSANPAHDPELLRDREAMAGLDAEQRERVRTFARSLPRNWRPPVMDASYFPPVKALPEETE